MRPRAFSTAYSHAGFGANFVEAAVHCETGEVNIRRMIGAFAAGCILNPNTAFPDAPRRGLRHWFGADGGKLRRFALRLVHQSGLDNHHVAVNADIGEMQIVFAHGDADSDPPAARVSVNGELAAQAPPASTPSTTRPALGG